MLAATVLTIPASTNTTTQPFWSVGALPYQLLSILNGYIHHSQAPSLLSSTVVHRTSQKRQRGQKPCPAWSPVKPPINLSWFAHSPPLSCVLASCHSGCFSVDPKSTTCHWPAISKNIDCTYRLLRRWVRWFGISISLRIFLSVLWSTKLKVLAESMKQMYFFGTLLLFPWSSRCWQFDLWFLCLF